jgi:hypothetical protein
MEAIAVDAEAHQNHVRLRLQIELSRGVSLSTE